MTLTEPAEGAEVVGNVEVEAVLDRAQLAEVTFALKAGAATEWTVLGTDDNPPYRIFHDVSGLAAGTPLQLKAIARDRSGNLDSDTATAVVGEVAAPQPGAARDYAVVHYQRADAAYDGWGVHVWGDVNEPDVTWATPKPLAGEDEFGRFAWVKLAPNASQVGFIVHKGDTKDPDGSPDRFFDPGQTPEIWLKSGDATVYTSRAAAQGYVELRYHRPDGVYAGWGLHLWGDAIDPSEATEWAAPKLPDRIDDYGAHWLVPRPGRDEGRQLHRPQGRREGHDRGPELPAGPEAVRLAAVGRLDRLRHARRRRGLRRCSTTTATTATTATRPRPTSTTSGACTSGTAPRRRASRGRPRCGRSAVTASGSSSRCGSSTARRGSPTSSTAATPRIPGPISSSTWTRSATRSGSCPATSTPTTTRSTCCR